MSDGWFSGGRIHPDVPPTECAATRVCWVGVSADVSRGWLSAIDASTPLTESVCDDVAARLDAMPSVLRSAFRVLDAGLAVLPAPVRRRAHLLPGVGEYVRVVHSLTAVSYYDLVTRDRLIPAPRTPNSPGVLAQPRA